MEPFQREHVFLSTKMIFSYLDGNEIELINLISIRVYLRNGSGKQKTVVTDGISLLVQAR